MLRPWLLCQLQACTHTLMVVSQIVICVTAFPVNLHTVHIYTKALHSLQGTFKASASTQAPPHLGAHKPRHPVSQSQVVAHLEALVEGVDVAQVAPGDDHPVGHLPVELLADLDGSCLLALQAQAVHAVGQVHRRLCCDLLQEEREMAQKGSNGEV